MKSERRAEVDAAGLPGRVGQAARAGHELGNHWRRMTAFCDFLENTAGI